jgi:hypothetical protein
LNLAERLVHALRVRVGDDDVRASFGEREGGMTANPFCAAGDNNHSSLHGDLLPTKIKMTTVIFFGVPSTPSLDHFNCTSN